MSRKIHNHVTSSCNSYISLTVDISQFLDLDSKILPSLVAKTTSQVWGMQAMFSHQSRLRSKAQPSESTSKSISHHKTAFWTLFSTTTSLTNPFSPSSCLMSPQRLQTVCSDPHLSAWGCLPFHHHPHILPQVNWGRRIDDGAPCNSIKIKASADLSAKESKDASSNNSWCRHVWYVQPPGGARRLSAKEYQSHQPSKTWTAIKGGVNKS